MEENLQAMALQCLAAPGTFNAAWKSERYPMPNFTPLLTRLGSLKFYVYKFSVTNDPISPYNTGIQNVNHIITYFMAQESLKGLGHAQMRVFSSNSI